MQRREPHGADRIKRFIVSFRISVQVDQVEVNTKSMVKDLILSGFFALK